VSRPASRLELLRYAWRYRHRYALGFTALLVCDAFELITPAVVAIVVDSLRPGYEPEGFQAWLVGLTGLDYARLALIMVGAVAIQGVLRYLWRVGFVFTSQLMARDIRADFFGKLTRLPASFYDHSQTGDIQSRASNDVEAVRMFLGIGTLILADASFYFLFVPILLFTWNPYLTGWLLLCLPLVPLVARSLSLVIHHRFERVQDELSALSAHAQECFAGVDVVRGFAREEAEIARFGVHSREYQHRTYSLWRAQTWMAPMMLVFVAIEELVVILIGGAEVRAGNLTPGQLVAFFFYLVMLTWPMEGLGWVLSLYQRGMASWGRLQEIMREPESITDGPRSDLQIHQGRVELDGVGFTYPGREEPALVDLDLVIEPGKTVALVGPIGSGKSTVARLVLRLHDVDEGTVRIDGVDVREYALASLRSAIGAVPQETFLFSASLRDNLAFGRHDASDDEIEHVTRLAALDDTIRDLPLGLDTLVGERGVTLSGGQKQRTALARALLVEPRILLLDDCLSAVDTRTEERILAGLREARTGRATLVATHRVTAITDADEIVVLDEGRVVDRGTHDELIARGGW
jgi:ATP-binding cassette subfamily B protein